MHAACRESRVDPAAKLHLLEVIELRAMHWVPNAKVANYYKQKLAELLPTREGPGLDAPASPEAPAPKGTPFRPRRSLSLISFFLSNKNLPVSLIFSPLFAGDGGRRENAPQSK